MISFETRDQMKIHVRLGIGKIIALILIFSVPPQPLLAGPPLVTDDPGILDPGSWETILAVAGEDRGDGRVFQLPVLDISRGVTANTQLSLLLPHFVIKPDDADDDHGLTTASIGYKWRFHSSKYMEWAIAANYTLPIYHDFISEDGPGDVRVLSVPILTSWQRADWTWLAQAGWNTTGDGNRFWDYGLAVSHPLGHSVQLMAEVYGYADLPFVDNSLNYQLGLDIEFTPALHVLASVGSRIKSSSPVGYRLNHSYYVGLQWFK